MLVFLLICWYKSKGLPLTKWIPSSFAFLIISLYCYEITIQFVWDYFWGAKLTIRTTGRGAMVGIKLERGGGWKNFEKLIMWSMYNDMKDFVA